MTVSLLSCEKSFNNNLLLLDRENVFLKDRISSIGFNNTLIKVNKLE